jgi:hypothetical protein
MKLTYQNLEQGRPLWMTNFGYESYAELLGGGGDLHSDRIYPECPRDFGEEE